MVEECWYKFMVFLMSEVCDMMGDRLVYILFDIDGFDFVFVLGIGIFEIGGLILI